jgi:hypothetical protein
MDVLVVESDPGVADAAIEALEAAHHRVLRCHDAGSPAFPCRGLDPGDCPLESGTVQVVLDVRGKTTPRPDPLEDGVSCALRRRLPVVVAGTSAINPFARFPVVDASRQDVVAACERAASGPQTEHQVVADRALEATLQIAKIEGPSHSEVHRTADGLRITLHVPAAASKKTLDMAAVRVAGAIRAFDAHAPRLDIQCEAIS